MVWYEISFAFGVITSGLMVVSLGCCGMLLLFDVEEEEGDTEKSGDGLEKVLFC